MQTVLRRCAVVAAAAGLLVPAVAQAQITVYNSLSGWLSAVSAPAIDSYDDLIIDEGFYDSPLLRTAGSYSYELSSANGFVPVGVAPDTWVSHFFFEDDLAFGNFSSGVRGIGGNFFPTLETGAVSAGTVQVTLTSGSFTSTQTLTNPTSSTFLGFTATGPLTSLSVRIVNPVINVGPFATVNDLRLAGTASVVPEPSTYVMLATGLLVLAAHARRRTA